MKKILPIILLSIIAINVNAQRFKGGIIAGLNASQVDGDQLGGYNKAGLLLGAFVYTNIDEKFSGQIEIKYSGKGSSTPKDALEIRKIKLNYIDMPILIGYEAFELLKIQVGLSFNYLFKAEYYLGGWTDNFDIFPHKFETAMHAGLNYKLLKSLDVNVRFNYSLLPIRAKTNGSTFMDENAWFNNVLSFGLYYQIGS